MKKLLVWGSLLGLLVAGVAQAQTAGSNAQARNGMYFSGTTGARTDGDGVELSSEAYKDRDNWTLIGSFSDTLNSAATVYAARREAGSGRQFDFLRLVNSIEYETDATSLSTNYSQLACSVGGTNAGKGEAPWTTDLTLTHLNAMEAGGIHDGGSGRNMIISTVWVMVDYTPAAGGGRTTKNRNTYFHGTYHGTRLRQALRI